MKNELTQTSPFNSSNENKDKELNPDFEGIFSPEEIKKEAEELINTPSKVTDHRKILNDLLEQIEPVDFISKWYQAAKKTKQRIEELQSKMMGPDGQLNSEALTEEERNELKEGSEQLSKIKLNQRHYLISSIENIEQVAKYNKWDLCKNQGFIYLYNGAYWMELNKDRFKKFLGEAALKMKVPRYNAKYYLFRDQLFEQFLSDTDLPQPEENNQSVSINLKNGTFEITPDGKTNLRPFNREDFLTYQLHFDYDPKATGPTFQKYLDRVLPDPERQRVLAEYMGYIFIKNGTGGLKLEKALLLYGSGHNGKSVLFDIINALLGRENVSSYSLESLTATDGRHRAMIANKLLNYGSEINRNMQTDNFKKLVSGEPVDAKILYQQPFEITQYAKLMFNVNELPKAIEHTTAFYRRFLIIPFDQTITQEEKDPRLADKIIKNELPGVFNWVLDGLNRLLNQGNFSECKAAREALERYRIESSSAQMFLNDSGYKSSPDRWQSWQAFYNEYREYCNDEGMHFFKKSNFKRQLQKLGITIQRGTGNQMVIYIEKDEEPDPWD